MIEGDNVNRFSEVRIVCTARGRHKSRELGLATFTEPADGMVPYRQALALDTDEPLGTEDDARRWWLYENVGVAAERLGRSGRVVTAKSFTYRDDVTNPHYRFKCPSCHLDVPLTLANLARLIKESHRAGIVALDLSQRIPTM